MVYPALPPPAKPPPLTVCRGFRPAVDFPFFANISLLSVLDIKHVVFNSDGLHDISCQFNNFLIRPTEPIDPDNLFCARDCAALAHDTELKIVINRARRPEADMPNTNAKYLSFMQLAARSTRHHVTFREQRADLWSALKKSSRCEGKVKLHQSLLMAISTKNVPRLAAVLATAHRKHQSPSAVLSLLDKAINGKYRPQLYTTDERALAVLILRIGGPCLMYAAHQANVIPALDSIT